MVKIKNETPTNIFHKSISSFLISTFKTPIPKRKKKKKKKKKISSLKTNLPTKSSNNHTLLFQTSKASSFSFYLPSSLQVLSSKCKQARGKKILHRIKHLIFIGRNKKGTKKGREEGRDVYSSTLFLLITSTRI